MYLCGKDSSLYCSVSMYLIGLLVCGYFLGYLHILFTVPNRCRSGHLQLCFWQRNISFIAQRPANVVESTDTVDSCFFVMIPTCMLVYFIMVCG